MRNSLAGNALKLSVANIITLTISMLSAMLLSRFRSLDEYGTYSQLIMTANLVTIFFMLGLTSSVNYFIPKANNEIEKQQFISVYFSVITILSLVTGIVLFASVNFISSYFENEEIKRYSLFLLIYPLSLSIISSASNIFVVYSKTRILLIFRVLNSIFLLLAIIGVQVLELSFSTYMNIFILLELLFSFCVYILTFHISGGYKFKIDLKFIAEIFRFTIPIGLSSVVGTLSLQLDKLLIGRMFDVSQMAIYSNASKELPISFIAHSISAVVLPHVTMLIKNNQRKKAMQIWKDSISLSFQFMCFFSVALFVFAPQILTILYSEKYVSGASVFRIYSLVLMLRTTYFGTLLNAVNKTKYIIYISLSQLLLNVILNLLFFRIFGYIGPAIATLVSMALSSYIYLVMYKYIEGTNVHDIISVKEIGKIILINFVMAMGVLLFIKIFDIGTSSTDIVVSIIVGFIWMLLYLFVSKKQIKEKWVSLSV